MAPLSPKRRSELRAQAHRLDPTVLIGDKGLTEQVIAEIDRSLEAHELIKVRAASGEREQRDIWLETICRKLEAHPVQQIGKVFVIYREKAEEAEKPAPAKAPRPRGEVVTDRGRQAQRARDAEKRRKRDIADMVRKGKIAAESAARVLKPDAAGASRPRSRTASSLPGSGPRRRRPRSPS